MSLISSDSIFKHENIRYSAESYFYRVEFQARGAPHIHCLLWLKGENGEIPPSMWQEENGEGNTQELAHKMANFGGSIISGRAKDMHCNKHSIFTPNCIECEDGKALVEKYQCHRHTFTCKKKGKVIRIQENEGHGRLDGQIKEEMILVPVCRFNHPRNPIDKTEFMFGFPENIDEEVKNKAKADYLKIRKYLLRLTNGNNFKGTKFENDENWIKFKQLSFYEFLWNVGMFETGEELRDENARLKARARYLTALRCEVKTSGLLLLRQDPEDILTNNFNKLLIKVHQANQDIQ